MNKADKFLIAAGLIGLGVAATAWVLTLKGKAAVQDKEGLAVEPAAASIDEFPDSLAPQDIMSVDDVQAQLAQDEKLDYEDALAAQQTQTQESLATAAATSEELFTIGLPKIADVKKANASIIPYSVEWMLIGVDWKIEGISSTPDSYYVGLAESTIDWLDHVNKAVYTEDQHKFDNFLRGLVNLKSYEDSLKQLKGKNLTDLINPTKKQQLFSICDSFFNWYKTSYSYIGG